jgi:hypothetical protein
MSVATGRTWRAIADYWAGDRVDAIKERYGYAPNTNIAAMAYRNGFLRRKPDTRRVRDPIRVVAHA